jgi:hypothetical protein
MNQIEHIMELVKKACSTFKPHHLKEHDSAMAELRTAIVQALEAQHHHPVSPELEREIEQALTPGEPDPSCDDVRLAEMILSDCGHSTNNTRLLERVTNRIARHTAPQPQPKQSAERGEPVAWQPIETAPKDVTLLLYGAKRLEMCVGMSHSRDGWVTDTTSEWASMYPPTHWMPLPPAPGTAPQPQHNWVGLTEQEIEEIDCVTLHQADWDEFMVYQPSVIQFARAIEAKLREKNS